MGSDSSLRTGRSGSVPDDQADNVRSSSVMVMKGGVFREEAEVEIRDTVQKYVTGSWAFSHTVVRSSLRGYLR